MSSTAAPALGTTNHASPSAPPDRGSGSRRRQPRVTNFVRNLVRAMRRDLAHATHPQATDWMPRLSQYPY